MNTSINTQKHTSVAFNGSFGSQILQRMVAGIAGAGVTSTSNIVGTKLGECN